MLHKDIMWYEKLDILASGIILNLSIFFISYIVLIGLAFPMFRYRYTSKFFLFGKPIEQVLVLWSWDFFLVMIGTALFQLVPIIGILKKSHRTIFRRICLFVSISFGSIINNTVQFLLGLLGIRATFLVTGTSRIKISSSEQYIFLSELTLGLGLCTWAITLANIWLLGVGMAMMFCYSLAKFGWNNCFVRIICYLPLTFFMVAIILLGLFAVR